MEAGGARKQLSGAEANQSRGDARREPKTATAKSNNLDSNSTHYLHLP